MKRIVHNFIKRSGLALASALVVIAGVSTAVLGQSQAISVSSANDCDDNAVMFCGADSTQALITKYTNGDGHNTTKSIHDIYNYFNISNTDVQALNTTAVAGRVTKAGDVFIDTSTTAVASAAVTAGRQDIGTSTTVTSNGTTFFTRPPGVSFQSDSLAAYVVMKDGIFQFAIIASCANPVKATPTPKPTPPPTPTPTPTSPSYTLTKEVALKGSNTFSQDVQVNQTAHVVYRVVVKSTGTGPVTNLTASDALPAGVAFVAGSFSLNGSPRDDTAAGQFFGAGLPLGTLNPGESITLLFEAVVGSTDTASPCTPQSLNNVAHTSATGLQPGSATATVNEQCVSTPQCTNLTVDKGDHTVTVTGINYLLNGATFQTAVIDWGDNTSTTAITDVNQVNGQAHKYNGNGPFTIVAHLTFSQNGQTVKSSGASCQAIVSFAPLAVQATSLVNTGPGSMLAMVTGVTVLGAFSHRMLALRRLR